MPDMPVNQDSDLQTLRADLLRLTQERERLEAIIVADGLDPAMPIPPGLNLQLQRLTQERDQLREQIAEAREACPAVRQQRFMDATLLEVVNEEISQLFRMQSRAEKAEHERDALIGSIRGVVEHLRAEAARVDTFHATMGVGYKAAADFLEPLLPPSSGGSA